jgi:hypothetical protein
MGKLYGGVRLSLIGVLLVSACGGSNDGAKERDPASVVVPDKVSESEFGKLVAEFGCYALAPCCTAAGYEYDSDVCRARYAGAFFLTPEANHAFDSTSGTACLRAYQTAPPTCGGVKPPACDTIYQGTQAVGDACSGDGDCVSTSDQTVVCDIMDGSVCRIETKGVLGAACDQTCEGAGEGTGSCYSADGTKNSLLPLNTHVGCDRGAGLYCNLITMQCDQLLDVGAPCSESISCAVGSSCYDTGTSFTCQTVPAVGQPCASGGIPCGADARCDANGTCQKMKAIGEACVLSSECIGSFCSGGLCADEWSYTDYVLGRSCGIKKG